MHFRHRFVALSIIGVGCLVVSSCSQSDPAPNPKVTSVVAPLQNVTNATQSTAKPVSTSVTNAESAVRRAISWNPQIQEATGRIGQQGELIADARSGYLPSIGGGVDLGIERGANDDSGPKFNVTARQMIYDFGKVSGSVEAQTAIHGKREAEFLATVDDVIRQTLEAINEISRNVQLERVAREQITDVQKVGDLVDARTERGASTKSDKLQAEARVQAAKSTALQLNGQKQRWIMTLVALVGGTANIGADPGFPKALNGACTGSEPNWDDTPALIAAHAGEREANARAKLATAEALPTLALEASSRLNLLDSDSDPDHVIGFTLRGDLYNGGSFKARRKAAEYAVQASAAAVGAARMDVQRSWTISVAQIASMKSLQASLASRQTMMRETRGLYQKQFIDLGTRTLLDVLNADQEFHTARFDEINTRYDLYKLNLECAHAAGRLREIFQLSPQTPRLANGKSHLRAL